MLTSQRFGAGDTEGLKKMCIRDRMMESLYSLIRTEADYDRYVNGTVRLSLYADFLYPLAEASTLKAFYEDVYKRQVFG